MIFEACRINERSISKIRCLLLFPNKVIMVILLFQIIKYQETTEFKRKFLFLPKNCNSSPVPRKSEQRIERSATFPVGKRKLPCRYGVRVRSCASVHSHKRNPAANCVRHARCVETRDRQNLQRTSKCRSTACEKKKEKKRKIMYKSMANGLPSADVCLMCETEHVSAKWVDAPGACMHTSSPRSQWPPNKFGTRDGRFMADSGPFLTHRQIVARVLIVDAPCCFDSINAVLSPSLSLSPGEFVGTCEP